MHLDIKGVGVALWELGCGLTSLEEGTKPEQKGWAELF